jgi:hypothetical protein
MGLDGAEVELFADFLREFIELRRIEARTDHAGHPLFQRLGQHRLRLSGDFDALNGVSGVNVVFGHQAHGWLLIPE